jgi:hypothetical protein
MKKRQLAKRPAWRPADVASYRRIARELVSLMPAARTITSDGEADFPADTKNAVAAKLRVQRKQVDRVAQITHAVLQNMAHDLSDEIDGAKPEILTVTGKKAPDAVRLAIIEGIRDAIAPNLLAEMKQETKAIVREQLRGPGRT